MQRIQVKYPSSRRKTRKLNDQIESIGLNVTEVYERMYAAQPVAVVMGASGLAKIATIYDLDRAERVDAFNADATLVLWFGEVSRPRHVRKIHDRMAAISDRVDRSFTVAIRPDRYRKGNRVTPSAITSGAINLTTLRMRAYVILVRSSTIDVARIYLHELGHVWFKDQKLGVVTVYGPQAAQNLALYHPRKARRSTENYSRFAKEQYIADGHPVTGDGFYSAV